MAPIREVADTYFGTTVADPYRYMENMADPEVVAWMKAQSDHTRAVLDHIPGRKDMFERIKALDDSGTTVTEVRLVAGKVFYFKLAPGDNNRKLYVRDSINAPERLLVDPEKLATASTHYSIDYFRPSHNGRLVAYGISPGGSEDSVLHVVDARTGRDLGESIDRARFNLSLSWRPDNRSFFYNRLQPLAAGAAQINKYKNSRVYLHVLGADPEKDPPVLGRGLSAGMELAEEDIPVPAVSPASSHALAVIHHGVLNELSLYAAPVSKVNGPATPWQKIVDVADEVTGFAWRGDELYLLTHKGASRFRVVRTRLSAPNPTNATEVVAPSAAVVKHIALTANALYVQDLDGGIGQLRRLPLATGRLEKIALPFEGAIQELVTDQRSPDPLLRLASWTRSSTLYTLAQGRAKDTGIIPPSPVDFSGIDSIEVKARSADGTLVPLSIIYKKNLKRDGANPTLLQGYGAYGITLDPSFVPTRLAWLERGGVLAVAHVRGGGEYGEDWHKAGQKLTKQNTISDFIACAEYLVNEKFTSSGKLGGLGGSAGGITVGRALTERPELFAAIIDAVGVSDALRIETSPNGPPNVPEFGSVTTADGFKGLHAMSSYHHVKDGTAYPAVMLTTGVNDPRVDAWQAAKMTARLQAATSNSKPILLRIDYDAGHGVGSTKLQRDAEIADIYTFLLWQFGENGFATQTKAQAR